MFLPELIPSSSPTTTARNPCAAMARTKKNKPGRTKRATATAASGPAAPPPSTTRPAKKPKLVRKPELRIPSIPSQYNGFHLPSAGWQVPRVSASSITPESFFTEFIAKRQPCIITGDTSVLDDATHAKWRDLTYLAQVAGAQRILVEEKGGCRKERQPTTFAEFLARIPASPNLYLTTQYKLLEDEPTAEESVKTDADDDDLDATVAPGSAATTARIADVFPPPLPPLLRDIPLIPSYFSTLVPQQLNLWIGNAPRGASSGLHHDFADNLYVLVQGRKRFTLFSPADAKYMDLYGTVKRVARNGLIVYEDDVRDDGAFPADVARWAVEDAQVKVDALEAQGVKDGEEWDSATARLEEAMDAMLEYAEDDLDFGGEDDFDADAFDDEDDEETADQFFKSSKSSKKRARPAETKPSPTDSTPSEPPSFSRIPVSALHPSDDLTTSPANAGHEQRLALARRVTCTLDSGDMLYLPASWFHEVTSYSGDDSDVHIALNYWMHPPTEREFAEPYPDGYWRAVWEAVERKVADAGLVRKDDE
ncbi:hypothetical protein AMAG_12895 [Allomyces macrogynus ATCC 38327]|uniref:JmjC domain-containing protein n=1 Tax=Allomyces macrogynus (strain ATCC 38327) TaxID=578462 RepID=A0A0L0T0D8_ALLM3|nr:hypothetical protein AMAG_12895 [Allomyces macrogynus ATCC 38327]|eukprot:KNE68217.1 hypothetical protein AMAG_12895 [Allomyces macrogynus ATCC 38327]